MKIELNAKEVRELFLSHLQKMLPMDLSTYEADVEQTDRYGRNPGGLEITLTKKPATADGEPVREVA